MLSMNRQWAGRDVSPKRAVPPPRQPLCDFRIDQRQRASTQRKMSHVLLLLPYYWKLRGFIGSKRKIAFHQARGQQQELQRQTKDNNEKTKLLQDNLLLSAASEKEAWNCYRKAEQTQAMYEGKYREATERCSELEQQYETVSQARALYESRIQGLAEESTTKTSKIIELEASNTELLKQRQETIELNSIRTEFSETKIALAEARSQAKAYEKAHLKLETTSTIASEKVQKELIEVKADLQATKGSYADLQTRFIDIKEIKDSLEESLREMKDDYSQTTHQNRELTSQVADKTSKVQRLQDDMHRLKEDFHSIKEKLTTSRIEASDFKSMVRSLTVRQECLQTEKQQLEMHLSDVTALEKETSASNTKLNDRIQTMVASLGEAQDRNLILESNSQQQQQQQAAAVNSSRTDVTDENIYYRDQMQLIQSELDQTRSNAKQRISDLMHQIAVEREKASSARKTLNELSQNTQQDSEKLKFAEKREATIYNQLNDERATTTKLSAELHNVLQTLNR